MLPYTRHALCLLVLSAACDAGRAISYTGLTLRVGPHKTECFYEESTEAQQKGHFHFQVTSGGALDIDAEITGPNGDIIWQGERATEERVMFKSSVAGTHAFCFNNKMSTMTYKTVSFDIAIGSTVSSEAGTMVADPIEQSIVKVTEGLLEIKQEQRYLRTRERIHRNTAEDTNSRVLYFSFFEIAVLVIMGAGQIFYLRRQFEVKRYV
ncbi:Transmembrane emp24 domain-containing protein A [Diplonema papillatum]|nr:Transmembrane emp24 domain-containing protein A [Diplonema papillatum]